MAPRTAPHAEQPILHQGDLLHFGRVLLAPAGIYGRVSFDPALTTSGANATQREAWHAQLSADPTIADGGFGNILPTSEDLTRLSAAATQLKTSRTFTAETNVTWIAATGDPARAAATARTLGWMAPALALEAAMQGVDPRDNVTDHWVERPFAWGIAEGPMHAVVTLGGGPGRVPWAVLRRWEIGACLRASVRAVVRQWLVSLLRLQPPLDPIMTRSRLRTMEAEHPGILAELVAETAGHPVVLEVLAAQHESIEASAQVAHRTRRA